MFCSDMIPRTSSPTTSGTQTADRGRSPDVIPGSWPSNATCLWTSRLKTSGLRVSITCLRGPMIGRTSSGNRTPRSIVYRKRTWSCSGSTTAMSTIWASKIAWILSPTRSYIACRSSFWARPCWTSLISASSAARSFVSASSRFVSSNSRAFSSATPMLVASVLSSRSSVSENASFSSRSSATTPVTRSPLMIGTPRNDSVSEPPTWMAPSAVASSSVPTRTGRRGLDDAARESRPQLTRRPQLVADAARRWRTETRSCSWPGRRAR